MNNKTLLYLVPFCLTALFAEQSLYLSDFHYLQNVEQKKILQNSETSNNVYKALTKLTSQKTSGIVPLKNSNFVAVYTASKQETLRIASELIGLGYSNFIFAKDEFGRYCLILPYRDIEYTRAVSRKLLSKGYNAQAFINNQRIFTYEPYYNNCTSCQNLAQKQQKPQAKTTHKKKVQNKTTKKIAKVTKIEEALPAECSIVEKMRDKTFFNPKTNVFVIDGVEYDELPKEFIACDATFVDATLSNSVDVKFTTEDNKTISGVLELPKEGILDDDFFWRPDGTYIANAETSALKKKEEVKKVVCDFSLPYGIRTSLDVNGAIIKLPQTYVGNSIELLYYIDGDVVKLSNSTFASITIPKSKFDKHCKKVEQ